MSEQAKAVLLDVNLVASFRSHLKKIKQKPSHMLPAYRPTQSIRLRSNAVKFLQKQLDHAAIKINNVKEKNVDHLKNALHKAGLSGGKLLPQKEKGFEDKIGGKIERILALHKKYPLGVDYYEKNGADAFLLAMRFKKRSGIRIFHVQSEPSGNVFSGDDPPNLHRIAKLPEAVI